MSRKIVIVTGVTSGIGLATAQLLHENGYKVYGIGRRANALQSLKFLHSYEVHDFSLSESFPKFLQDFPWEDSWDEIHLINNAGTADPIAPVTELTYDGLLAAYHTNTASAIFLSQKFYLELLSRKNSPRARIINIISGAAFHGYAGWTGYCTTKAALWAFTQVFALEMDQKKCQIMALSPGVVETLMQMKVREQDEAIFPNAVKFRELKKSGKLFSPDQPAAYLLQLLSSKEFPHGKHTDLRDVQGS